MREIKLCPFCGKEATIVDFWDEDPAGYAFRCTGCGIETPRFESAEDAARFWNRRARLDEPRIKLWGGGELPKYIVTPEDAKK